MRKVAITLMLICMTIFCMACRKNTETSESKTNTHSPTASVGQIDGSISETPQNKVDTFIPDVSIEQIGWSISSGTVKGENYVISKVTNNSQFSITSLEITFTEKQGITKEEKNAFYSAIQKSQGFDDEYMKAFIESRESLSQPISMYFRINETISIGQSKEQIKCYYLGGWNSNNVIYPDLFIPNIATIQYEKSGATHTLYYNFSSKSYELAK